MILLTLYYLAPEAINKRVMFVIVLHKMLIPYNFNLTLIYDRRYIYSRH